ncbi:hypothetical protein [Solicola sp. PLA-1-18]|uniref:hypothetical protein n=1 Tax=Solicola sp. PLA-1-18 TaxID=3380532 RepID=UPI003B7BC2C5
MSSRPTAHARRSVLVTSLLVTLGAVVLFGALVAASLGGVSGPAIDVTSLVGVVVLLVAHLWASRSRWLASIALVVLPALALFAAPAVASRDGETPVAVGALVVGAVLTLASTSVAVWVGNRWGPSGPMGDINLGV